MKNLNVESLPILINEDKRQQKRMLDHGQRLCNYVKELGLAYQKINIGTFDDKAYKTLIRDGVAVIEKQFIDDVTKRYESLGLRSDTMEQEVLADAKSLINILKAALEKLRDQALQAPFNLPQFPLASISINEEGKPQISEADQKQLTEQFCRTYLETPEELSVYVKLQTAADAINEVMAEAAANNAVNLPIIPGQGKAKALIMESLWENEGGLYVSPDIASWIVKQYRSTAKKAA